MSTSMYIAKSTNKEIIERAESGVVTSLLRCALETGYVDAVVTVRAKNGDRYSGVPVIISKSADLLDTIGTLHCMAPNIPRFVKEYLEGASKMKLAVVGKPCDIRAIRELQKREQINIENLVMIGLNCTGTLDPVIAKKMLVEEFSVNPHNVKKLDINDGEITALLEDGSEIIKDLDSLEKKGYGRRESCRRCVYNIPSFADIACGRWGTEQQNETFIEVCTDKGSALIERAMGKNFITISKADESSITVREKRDAAEIKRAMKWREYYFKPLEDRSIPERFEYWNEQFSNCIKCFGCRDACPICYCESCLLEASRKYLANGEIPPNIQFHLTRLAHVADSCIGCGQCSDACPMDIPLSRLFSLTNQKLNDVFAYSPGIDTEQGPPLITASDDELMIDDTFLNVAETMKRDKK